MWLAKLSWSARVAEILVEDPNATIEGLPFVAAAFGGMVVGFFAGALFGMILSRILPPSKSDP